ncbi:hypothetical protein CPB83DRAFT_853715 [Crepidotus variabilis]|uniref:Uncharacterized protein n=1 Tax=Crepidotus variabilis TaxID=179855 RepID=A0A9P6EFT6_9AGAR|nr:hypothetical protein CPB83DRAFT_853715 [Crepidotus variabilis]
MESLNLNTLASSLPAGQQNAEKELLNDFKAAALSITKLYRSSRKTSKRAYNAGYGAACQDLLTFIQQGVSAGDVGQAASAGSSQEVEGGGMTIGRVMDRIEARLEAIRATEEDEDEDEEREKDKERPVAPGTTSRAPAVAPATPSSTKIVAKKLPSQRSKDTAPPNNSNTRQSSEHSSSSLSPPPSAPLALPSKTLKMRTLPSHSTSSNGTPHRSEPFPTTNPSTPVSFSEPPPIVFNAGTKRRHAMMMMLDASSPTLSISPGTASSSSTGSPATGPGSGSVIGRRRTRSSRNIGQHQSQNQNINLIQVASEAMDIEEDGRERKRVARR